MTTLKQREKIKERKSKVNKLIWKGIHKEMDRLWKERKPKFNKQGFVIKRKKVE